MRSSLNNLIVGCLTLNDKAEAICERIGKPRSTVRNAVLDGRGLPPLWAKNELRYLDTYLTPCEAEQPIRIQWFRIAEDGYNGADEGELWWKGNIYSEDLPSERLRKKPVVRL